MICAWNSFISLLPLWMRSEVDKLGADSLLELRLRLDMPVQLIMPHDVILLKRSATSEDIRYCVNTASKYSPWSAWTSKLGYITAAGGHRIGLCGQAAVMDEQINTINVPTSLCMRVARDFPGISRKLCAIEGSVLIIGKPGSGKTTLLRDYIRHRGEVQKSNISVIDEKGEIFPLAQGNFCFRPGNYTDVLFGCSKQQGIDLVLRNMAPATIAVDEITEQRDCEAILKAGWCGVDLVATAHASSKKEFLLRSVYKPLVESGLFDHLIVLHEDKSWHLERMNL